MSEPYPIHLGARKARREHNQHLVAIPKRLIARWAIGDQTLLFWTLVDDTTAVLTKLDPPPPSRPWPIDSPMHEPIDDHNHL